MKLHLLSYGLWTVLAVYADEERCDVLDHKRRGALRIVEDQ